MWVITDRVSPISVKFRDNVNVPLKGELTVKKNYLLVFNIINVEPLASYLLHFRLKSIKLMVPLLQDINDLPI